MILIRLLVKIKYNSPSHIVYICLLAVSDAPSDDAPQWAEHTQITQIVIFQIWMK